MVRSRHPDDQMAYIIVTLSFYFFVSFITGSLGLFLSFLLYLHYIHKVNEHLPGPPRSSFVLGNLPEIRQYRKNGGTFPKYRLEIHAKYGPIAVFFLVHRAVVGIADPGYISEILNDFNRCGYKPKSLNDKVGHMFGQRFLGTSLLTNLDDESWRRRRQIMNPAFHRRCLKKFMKDYNEVSDRFMVRMTSIAGQETSMLREFANLTLDVISQVSFNVKLGAIEDRNCPFAAAITSAFRGLQTNVNIPLPASILSIFQFRPFQSASMKEQIDAVKFLRKFAFDCITKRINDIKANKKVPEDLLTLLVNEESLLMDDIIDEFVLIFVAGQETTASSLAFAIFEIAQNPDIEARILNELNDVLGSKRNIDFEDLSKLKYLGQVLQESLRKYPVAGGPGRFLRKEVIVGGYKIPKVTMVVIDKYMINHNPKVWSNPEIFDPERFAATENIPHFNTSYFPFSFGPRNCIGQTFAKFESKVVLARLLRKFQFELLPGQTDVMEERFTMAPRDGVMCKVMLR